MAFLPQRYCHPRGQSFLILADAAGRREDGPHGFLSVANRRDAQVEGRTAKEILPPTTRTLTLEVCRHVRFVVTIGATFRINVPAQAADTEA